jgi:uncharacterized protein (TIGR04255 family)
MPVLGSTPEKLPVRLGKPPLVDAVFEVRFQATQKSIAQLLPGFFFSRLGKEYPRSEAMPIASLPAEFRDMDASLRYQFHYRLSGETAAILVGDRSAAVSALTPYQGWDEFRPRIDSFLKVLDESKLVHNVERFSLKFVNVISSTSTSQLHLLNLELAIGGVKPSDSGFQLRTELNDADLVRIIEIRPHAVAKLRSKNITGLMLSIDCIQKTPGASISDLHLTTIEKVHLDLKQLFFGLITPATLSSLEPHY